MTSIPAYSEMEPVPVAAVALSALGAINAGLQEFANMDLAVEVLGSNAEIAYAVFAIGGVALAAQLAGMEVLDE